VWHSRPAPPATAPRKKREGKTRPNPHVFCPEANVNRRRAAAPHGPIAPLPPRVPWVKRCRRDSSPAAYRPPPSRSPSLSRRCPVVAAVHPARGRAAAIPPPLRRATDRLSGRCGMENGCVAGGGGARSRLHRRRRGRRAGPTAGLPLIPVAAKFRVASGAAGRRPVLLCWSAWPPPGGAFARRRSAQARPPRHRRRMAVP